MAETMSPAFPFATSGATAFPPPLWGRDREGGIARADFATTPLPNPPPQGGREQAEFAATASDLAANGDR
jgi:hypothetical protein